MLTYIIKNIGDSLKLKENYEINGIDQGDIDNAIDAGEINRSGVILDDSDRLLEGDWVYISKSGKLLHIDDSEVQKYGKLKYELNIKYGFNIDNFADKMKFFEYQRLYNEAVQNAKCLNEEDDEIYTSREKRLKRLEGNR